MATNTKKQRVTLFINPLIAKHAKAQAIIEEKSLATLIELALVKYLPQKTVIEKAKIGTSFDDSLSRR